MNRHQRRRTRALGIPGPGSSPDQLADRLHMIEHNELAVQQAVAELREASADLDVAFLIVDSRDSLGRQIAAAVDPERGAEKIAGTTQIPTIIMSIPRQAAYADFRHSHPHIARGLERPAQPGTVVVVCIASEGITMVHLPVRRPPASVKA